MRQPDMNEYFFISCARERSLVFASMTRYTIDNMPNGLLCLVHYYYKRTNWITFLFLRWKRTETEMMCDDTLSQGKMAYMKNGSYIIYNVIWARIDNVLASMICSTRFRSKTRFSVSDSLFLCIHILQFQSIFVVDDFPAFRTSFQFSRKKCINHFNANN